MSSIKKILIRNFRNIEMADLSFCASINCICGSNGQGKTNLLDAIYYLSMTKSSLGVSDSFCIRQGCDEFAISGMYDMPDGMESRFVAVCNKEGKVFKRDDKPYKRLCEHIGKLPVVMVSPMDSGLITESGDLRRRFVNAVISQMDVHYLIALQKYNRLLSERNMILKNDATADASLLDVLESQMSEQEEMICASREEFARELALACSKRYACLCDGNEEVSVSYRSDSASLAKAEFAALLKERRKKDFIVGYTTTGPQRDDFEFCINGLPLRKCGSQGQQKSFLVAVKLSQFEIMKQRNGSTPILLLDDLFDKLDQDRTFNLLSMFDSTDFSQVFISDTSRQRVESIISRLGRQAAFFNAENGSIQLCAEDGK